MKRILLVTEANERVASGHLIESLVCRQYLKRMGVKADLLVNEDMPSALKDRIQGEYFTYQSNIQKETAFLAELINSKKYTTILFNLRKVENDFLDKIRGANMRQIVCIDEFGNRRLDADIIVNPMIDKYFWKYDSTAKLYCGADYLVLPMELQKFRKRPKGTKDRIKRITVSMGGVDVGNTTLKLAKWLPLLDNELEINLVLGGAYKNGDELRRTTANNHKIKLYYNISYLDKLFFESDLAFCAGGNTLHELAVLGIPSIIIPSMPHEVRNGKAFESAGFSLCGSISGQFSYQELKGLYGQIKTKQTREEMRNTGKKLVDGKGYERIFRILNA